jgi:hypothetical protein
MQHENTADTGIVACAGVIQYRHALLLILSGKNHFLKFIHNTGTHNKDNKCVLEYSSSPIFFSST